MTAPKYPVRTSVKAIICRAERVLLLKFRSSAGAVWYGLPGGGQERGESLVEALHRECLEEISAEIEVGDLVLVRDYIADRHDIQIDAPGFHQVEFMFLCSVPADFVPRPGNEPDQHQVAIEWVAFAELKNLAVYPSGLAALVPKFPDATIPVYMGAVN